MPNDRIADRYTGDEEQPRSEPPRWRALVWIVLLVGLVFLIIVMHGTGLMPGLHGGTHGG